MTHRNSSDTRHTAVVGLQWGDEGKGKIVDLLTAEHDVIVRYNGGANAGHTLVVDEERYALHLIPAGILYPDKVCVVANGVVVDPAKLVEEIAALQERGIEIGDNLRVSDRAHVVLPYHKAYDKGLEEFMAAGDSDTADGYAIGTTLRGIGPAYADKVYRSTALRTADLLRPDRLREKLRRICAIRAIELDALGYRGAVFDADDIADECARLGRLLEPYLTDTTYLLHDFLGEGRSMLMEGANACLLDVDHGTFPYVTSSNSSTLGIPAGTGIPLGLIDRVVGTMKGYATRVGAGPFPSEDHGETGERIRDRGQEYGTTTGRPRRCGWLDLVAVRYSVMICGVTELACMLLDVLSGFDEIRLCTHYRLPDGTLTDRFLPDADRLEQVEPVYETLPGWTEEIDATTDRDALPPNAQAYLRRIEEIVEVPVEIVSVGPERSQTLLTI